MLPDQWFTVINRHGCIINYLRQLLSLVITVYTVITPMMSAGIHGDSACTLVCDVIVDPISPPRSGFKKHSKQAEAL